MPASKNTSDPQPATADWSTYPLSLSPGERPLIFTHEQYRFVRAADRLGEYDILMRQPDVEDGSAYDSADEDDRWQPVEALKYLKHRALEWRETERASDLPTTWRDRAEALDAALAASAGS